MSVAKDRNRCQYRRCAYAMQNDLRIPQNPVKRKLDRSRERKKVSELAEAMERKTYLVFRYTAMRLFPVTSSVCCRLSYRWGTVLRIFCEIRSSVFRVKRILKLQEPHHFLADSPTRRGSAGRSCLRISLLFARRSYCNCLEVPFAIYSEIIGFGCSLIALILTVCLQIACSRDPPGHIILCRFWAVGELVLLIYLFRRTAHRHTGIIAELLQERKLENVKNTNDWCGSTDDGKWTSSI